MGLFKMRFTEIGQQLRAYRLESGLRAEEIAARLGVSRAALYRYEKGEVIKLDTVKRLAELLKISPLSLLGIGVEYYNRPVGYFERIRQTEETADQILHVFGSLCYLTTSDSFDAAFNDACTEVIEHAGHENAAQRAALDQVQGIMAARKRMYAMRKPSIIAILSMASIQRLLEHGIASSLDLSDGLRRRCRQVAVAEIENIATLMETEPMGVQFGVLPNAEPTSTFKILRARDRATLAINPFRPDGPPSVQTGVAMITGADEAIATHQRVAESMWRDASKGAAGAGLIRRLIQHPARAVA
jgi:transcriptional regulator with XRE-family HTH domain